MDMRVVFEPLCPGVQDGEEADSGSQPFWIGGHFGKRFGYGTKQDSVNDPRILKRQRSQFTGSVKTTWQYGTGRISVARSR